MVLKLRPYQQDAYDKTISYLQTNKKCLIKMFCGTGKSIIITKLIEHSITTKNGLNVIVFPSLALIQQFYDDYLETKKTIKSLKSFPKINISSREITGEDEAITNEIHIQTTTDPLDIQKFLNKTGGKIICISYQSLQTLLDNLNGQKIDLICFDESHRTTGEKYKNLIYYKPYSSLFEKQIFFTATPVNRNGITMFDRERDEVGMYDDCGKCTFEFSYMNALNIDAVSPFNIYVDLFTEQTNNSIYESISRNILKTGNNRVLTFHNEVNENSESNSVLKFVNYDEFIISFNTVLTTEFPDKVGFYNSIRFQSLTAETKNKKEVLQDFAQTKENEIFILSSCRTIGEGVDTKMANSVVFADPKSSIIDIIQNIGRCLRNVGDNKKKSIIIPNYIDKTKYIECGGNKEECDKVIRQEMTKNDKGDFSPILNVLAAIKQEDPELYEQCLKYPQLFTEEQRKKVLKENGYDIDEENGITEYELEELIENDEKIEVLTNNVENPLIKYNEENEGNATKYYKFEEQDDDGEIETMYYPVKNKTKKEVDSKDLCPKVKNKPMIEFHTNDEIKLLWKISEEDLGGDLCSAVIECEVKKVDNVEVWMTRLEEVKKYIDENGKRPSETSKNQYEKKLGRWTSTQQTNYKKYKDIMKQSEIRKQWEDFIDDLKYSCYFQSNKNIWETYLEKVKNYIKTNNKLPSQHEKNIEVKKLGCWISHQQKNYKNNKHIMKQPEIRKQWEDFITDPEFSKYFQSNEQKWFNNFEKVVNYIETNNKLPSLHDKKKDVKKLGNWVVLTNQKYRKNKQNMQQPEIRKKWEDFINDYKYSSYFVSNDEIWLSNLEKVKKYINENKKKPSDNDTNPCIKKLGSWICTQQTNYKKKADTPELQYFKKLWEKFINEPEISSYFKSNIDVWITNQDEVINYIKNFKKLPSKHDKNQDIKKLGTWISNQHINYKNNQKIFELPEIKEQWEKFINNPEYSNYFQSNEEIWKKNLEDVKNYININGNRPSPRDKKLDVKQLGSWIYTQQHKFKNNKNIMKQPEIRKQWEEFINDPEFSTYFNNVNTSDNVSIQKNITETIENSIEETPEEPIVEKPIELIEENISLHIEPVSETKLEDKPIVKKSHKLKVKLEKPINDKPKKLITKTKYTQLSNKFSIQNSENTHKQLQENPEDWYEYHNYRDHSFKGYEQEEIPVNRIIKKLEKISNRKLRILDLGCGRNHISEHFKDNSKMTIVGYDHVSCNGSKVGDISNLMEEEDETVDICVYSQALMGSNKLSYLEEGKRVLRYNGEMIISEHMEMLEQIKTKLKELKMNIIEEEITESKWFIISAIKRD